MNICRGNKALKKPQLVPFMVKMVDQSKVQLVGLIRNLKIDLARCTFKILVIVLQMEDTLEAYLMFLGRPWLNQAKVHHDWGYNTLTIMANQNNDIEYKEMNNGTPFPKTLQS